MEAAQRWRLGVTHWPPGFVILVSAFVLHLALALWKLSRLRTRPRRNELWLGASSLLVALLIAPI